MPEEHRPGRGGDEGGRPAQPATDPAELAKRAWLDLDGVTDEWIKGLKVETVAGGGRPALLDPAGFAALFDGRKSCCGGCCCVGE